ncbi:MAG: hypothetical protein AB7Q17_04660 [Phycisphaerae bacterium]
MVVTLLILGALAGPGFPSHSMRVWFSTTGVPDGVPIEGTPPEYISRTDGVNPTFVANGSLTYLYIWATMLTPENDVTVRTVSLDVNVHPVSGDVALVERQFYNPVGTIAGRRWNVVNPGALSASRIDDVVLDAIDRRGLSSADPGDIQFDPASFSWLLGRVGFIAAPGSRAELFFGIGNQGFLFVNALGSDAVYFGWGDAFVRAYDFGRESALPDAFIVPEPGGASLLVLTSAAAFRRRR